MTHTPMSTEERLNKLENDLHQARRRNRWLLVAALCACIGVGAAAWMLRPHTLPAPKEVRAEGFVLVDAKGNVRADLATDPDGAPSLSLFADSNAEPRVTLGLDTDGAPALRLAGPKGYPRVNLRVNTDGALSLVLSDSNKQPRAILGLDTEGAPSLNLGGPLAAGFCSASLSVNTDGAPALLLLGGKGNDSAPSLLLFDAKGKGHVHLSLGSDGAPSLALYDSNQHTRASLGLDTDGAPSLLLFDAKGNGRAALGVSQTTTKNGKLTTFPESSLLLFDPDGTLHWKTP